MELTTSKENLKNFIERWEEHPNSPYVFDASATLILPVHDGEKNTSSGFSSRGCSPSPCESLSSNTELFKAEISAAEECKGDSNGIEANIAVDTDVGEIPFKSTKSSLELCDRPSSSASILKQNKEYLQSFDRRHSDSNYYVSNHTSSLEKVNLAEEIKKLSNRLLILSSINAEIQDYNQRASNNKPSGFDFNSIERTLSTEQTKNLKNSKLNDSFGKSTDHIETTATTATTTTNSKSITTRPKSIITNKRSSDGQSTHITSNSLLVNDQETPSRLIELSNSRSKTSLHDSDTVLSSSLNSSDTSLTNTLQSNGVPWPVSNRRTKFRITQLSRDVSHDTIFLEEAANTTKCLLHLLDKYNGREESRSSSGIRRHQSISVGGAITNNLEYQSMNSINAFFKRNVFQKSGTIVKQIQTRLEAKSNQ